MASTRRRAAILAADVAVYDIVRRSWTESSQTPSWREVDSNFQNAGTGELVKPRYHHCFVGTGADVPGLPLSLGAALNRTEAGCARI